jgi:hypothetical protein
MTGSPPFGGLFVGGEKSFVVRQCPIAGKHTHRLSILNLAFDYRPEPAFTD